jgi:rod shape-determining protein MreC
LSEWGQRLRRLVLAAVIIAAVVTSMSLTAGPRVRVVRVSNWMATAVSPISFSLSWIGHKLGAAVTTVTDLYTLQKQNVILRHQLLQYDAMKLELSEVLNDNGQLRSLLGLKRALGSWTLVPASIIARSPSSWFDTVIVDQGSSAGVEPGQSVIVAQGVVGRVVGVSPSTATVMLILDPKSGVGVIDARSQAAGVVSGQNPVTGVLTFQLFSHRPNVDPGDAVTTSGYSQYYPKGLLVGQVVNVAKTQYGLTETATVKPSVDFNSLDRVMIVVRHPSGTSLPPIFGGGSG